MIIQPLLRTGSRLNRCSNQGFVRQWTMNLMRPEKERRSCRRIRRWPGVVHLLAWLIGASASAGLPTQPKATLNIQGLRDAIQDLRAAFGHAYEEGTRYLAELDELERRLEQGASNAELTAAFSNLQRRALLCSPLLQSHPILAIRRQVNPAGELDGRAMGLPQNWQGNCALPRKGYVNAVVRLDPPDFTGEPEVVFAPTATVLVADIELNYDADRLLFSMPDPVRGSWQIWEYQLATRSLRAVTTGFPDQVDNYDPVYLPDGDIVFASTACIAGVPCVGGSTRVANLFRCRPDGSGARQLCFDQEHNWCPTMLPDGRVLYSRWEYTDTPHYFTRLLFAMNPDGTGQRAVYGSNSWWPNSIFYARPIPGLPGWIVAIVSGHHGVARMGELILFDVRRGERDAEGAVQRIPGRGRKVEPVIADQLVNHSWPKFLHPYPLGDETAPAVAGKFFLVSAKPSPAHRWGLYLVDVYDNMVLIRDEPGWAWLEPLPLKPRSRPPVIPSQVDPNRRDATVLLADVYAGDAMQGVPRGVVRSLRLFAYNYALPGTGGHIDIGIDGPWDARRILGTVPVEEDGSAHFTVPANTPIALQPLDEAGRAVQIMRSWFTAMPGERLSCAGCHERNAEAAPPSPRKAFLRPPSRIEPWRGPERPFSFRREVQPVLDRHCVRCHDGTDPTRPDFRVNGTAKFRHFTPSYVALHPYVHRPGPESDYRIRPPGEYYAETSELVFRLSKSHHGVELSQEDWDRLVTWIDLNVPDLGTWTERIGRRVQWADLRVELRSRYANLTEDWELYPDHTPRTAEEGFTQPKRERLPKTSARFPRTVEVPTNAPYPRADPPPFSTVRLEVSKGIVLEMVRLPAGRFRMGDPAGFPDEQPVFEAEVARPFWISRTEIPNKLFALFDPSHDSMTISPFNKDHSHPGFPANGPDQPVIRVSWHSARAFCQWLSDRIGSRFDLPTEVQWEYACRAGTSTPMWYGEVATDFRRWANLADEQLVRLCIRDSPPWIPRIGSVNDGAVGPAPVGRYSPNPWGLADMHGNVAEWTRSAYAPYPNVDDGTSDAPQIRRVVRGGSWRDRPALARSACRWPLPPWGRYATVGFRVVCEDDLLNRVASVTQNLQSMPVSGR